MKHRRVTITRIISTLVCVICVENSVFAHNGKPHNWHDLWRTWSFEPVVVVSLAFTGFLFLKGIHQLWNESGRGRGIRRWEVAAFAGGWLALAMFAGQSIVAIMVLEIINYVEHYG
ncbi:MAG: hypothetical protein ABR555_14930, partial [Pyrinomonadaceae bacterium]